MKENKLKKGILVILIANIINLSLSVIRNFLMPKFLSIDSYATIKSYQLYISFISIFAFGYIDGMYLKYGGLNRNKIDSNDFHKNISTFRIFQIIISLIMVIISLILKNLMFFAVGITIIALNVTDYIKSFYQAIGEFDKYSKITKLTSIFLFIINIVLLLIIKIDNPYYYVFSNILIYYVIWIASENKLGIKNNINKKELFFSKNELKFNISSGIVLMLGLLLSNFMTGIDRWFIKITMDTKSFAAYSFSASMESFLNYITSPISITLYNYFCKEKNAKIINNKRKFIIFFLSLLIAIAFPIKFIIENYIDKYVLSINILFILFVSQLLSSVVKCFYINLYKSQKMQKIYFKRIFTIFIFAILINIILFCILKNMMAYAIGTLLSSALWIVLCERDLKKYCMELKEKIYIMIVIISYIYTGIFLNPIIGLLLYFITIVLFQIILYKNENIKYIKFELKKLINRRRKNNVK